MVSPMIQTASKTNSGEMQCGRKNCGNSLRFCDNYSKGVCNRTLTETNNATLCNYCELTRVIPDLSIDGNLAKWKRLESAKRRVLMVLEFLGLPLHPGNTDVELSFEFKADGEKPVATGHQNGCITINVKEADSIHREKARVQFGEPQRTLVGHFRHELGHYIWDRVVLPEELQACREIFGNETKPTYQKALDHYYKVGPPKNWGNNFISAYATMHPWEDFAETFGAYLDMIAVLQTASHFKLTRPDFAQFDDLISCYQQIGQIGNELNRDMGLLDLVPEVFMPPVIKKLEFIHSLTRLEISG